MLSRNAPTLLIALLGLALTTACSSAAKITTVDEVFAANAAVTSATSSEAAATSTNTLVFVVLHVRPPARLSSALPSGTSAVLIPEHLRLEHPRSEQVERNGVFVLQEFNPKVIDQYDPSPPPAPLAKGEERLPPETVYAPMTAEPRVFTAKGEIAIGWAGVGSRVWVRPCSHGFAGRIDLLVENDVLDRVNNKRERVLVHLESAWFPGVDTVYRSSDKRSIVTGDPGREGVPVVVVRAAK